MNLTPPKLWKARLNYYLCFCMKPSNIKWVLYHNCILKQIQPENICVVVQTNCLINQMCQSSRPWCQGLIWPFVDFSAPRRHHVIRESHRIWTVQLVQCSCPCFACCALVLTHCTWLALFLNCALSLESERRAPALRPRGILIFKWAYIIDFFTPRTLTSNHPQQPITKFNMRCVLTKPCFFKFNFMLKLSSLKLFWT